VADLEDIGLDQSERLISVEYFALGAKKIVVIAFDGVEELSTLTTVRLEVMTLGRALKKIKNKRKKMNSIRKKT